MHAIPTCAVFDQLATGENARTYFKLCCLAVAWLERRVVDAIDDDPVRQGGSYRKRSASQRNPGLNLTDQPYRSRAHSGGATIIRCGWRRRHRDHRTIRYVLMPMMAFPSRLFAGAGLPAWIARSTDPRMHHGAAALASRGARGDRPSPPRLHAC
jgi:hypothetical protein